MTINTDLKTHSIMEKINKLMLEYKTLTGNNGKTVRFTSKKDDVCYMYRVHKK